MSGNRATRRKAERARFLAAYREDGRFSSLSAFIENERLAAALRGEPDRKRYEYGSVRLGDLTLHEIAEALNKVGKGRSAVVTSAGTVSVSEAFKGTSNVSISSISSKR